ncbi:hypothetical protein EDB86DRAFT_2834190 [Lactarius hatsudake]|nr:hypothetical protein EDB86DRAFT_2834190 [Lactarius hatsudake]
MTSRDGADVTRGLRASSFPAGVGVETMVGIRGSKTACGSGAETKRDSSEALYWIAARGDWAIFGLIGWHRLRGGHGGGESTVVNGAMPRAKALTAEALLGTGGDEVCGMGVSSIQMVQNKLKNSSHIDLSVNLVGRPRQMVLFQASVSGPSMKVAPIRSVELSELVEETLGLRGVSSEEGRDGSSWFCRLRQCRLDQGSSYGTRTALVGRVVGGGEVKILASLHEIVESRVNVPATRRAVCVRVCPARGAARDCLPRSGPGTRGGLGLGSGSGARVPVWPRWAHDVEVFCVGLPCNAAQGGLWVWLHAGQGWFWSSGVWTTTKWGWHPRNERSREGAGLIPTERDNNMEGLAPSTAGLYTRGKKDGFSLILQSPRSFCKAGPESGCFLALGQGSGILGRTLTKRQSVDLQGQEREKEKWAIL